MDENIKIIDGYQYIDQVKELIIQYIQELNRNLDFQDFNDELEHLSQKYAKPEGRLLVAIENENHVVGCVAFHRFDETRCEMKRLYVLPQYRSQQVGQMLVQNIIQYAYLAGYQDMLLDTIVPLKSAICLYKKLGFQEIDAYYDNPMDDVIYMSLKLKEGKNMIRLATQEDLESIIKIEQICFPQAEAATAKEFQERFDTFQENFIVAVINDQIVGFINGATTSQPLLPDELYHNVHLHNPKGDYQTVFGLDVLPDYRNQGIAGELLNFMIVLSKERGKKGIVLTCKDHLIHYYEKFGFVHQGQSSSNHGGATWNDMLLLFKK